MSQENNRVDVKKQSTGRKMLLGLAVVFILPFTIAATLHILDIRPSGKSFGNLITPPIPLNFPILNELKGEDFLADRWNKIWTIVMIDDKSCAEICQKNVDKLNRVHLSLPKEIDRVQRVLILQGEVDLAKTAALQAEFSDLIVLTSSNVNQEKFVEVFTSIAPKDSIYLVDPLNNLMMHYPHEVTPKELRADVKRLLKNSWGG
jgi:cytochrome oxidase Cu insertion factor (SCO1/SenC/PrrC family)